MKRFVKEYANYKLANRPFLISDVRNTLYINYIEKAVINCEKGFITINEAMNIIANAEQYAEQEAKIE